MDVITDPASVAVGDFGTASEANSYKAAIDAIVRRIGGRATTNAAQAIAASTLTTLTNNGTAAWTATEDSGGFVSGTGGTTTPLVIPTGKGGLYVVGCVTNLSVQSTARMYAQPLVNGAAVTGLRWVFYSDIWGADESTFPLNAGDTLGLRMYTDTAANIATGCQLYCYRIGN